MYQKSKAKRKWKVLREIKIDSTRIKPKQEIVATQTYDIQFQYQFRRRRINQPYYTDSRPLGFRFSQYSSAWPRLVGRLVPSSPLKCI